MKKYQLFFLILFFAGLNSSAQNVRGISIESSCERVVVFLNNEQVCDPVESCMIANLPPGYYYIQAFAIDHRGRYNRSVYSKRIYFDGNGVAKIELLDNYFGGVVPHFPSIPPPPPHEPYYDDVKVYFEPMSTEDFNRLLAAINKASFKQDKLAVIDLVADEQYLSVSQLGRVMDRFSFDDEKLSVVKKLYPNVVDKENVFTLLEKFAFASSKTTMKDYIKEEKRKRDNGPRP